MYAKHSLDYRTAPPPRPSHREITASEKASNKNVFFIITNFFKRKRPIYSGRRLYQCNEDDFLFEN